MRVRTQNAIAMLAISLLASCATVPPPSQFNGAKWSGQSGFEYATAYIRNGKFVAPPPAVSEVIDLGGLYAVSPTGQPIPRVGAAADFDLYKAPPQAGQTPSARVRGGKLVK